MSSTIHRQGGGASNMQHQHSPQPSSAASTPAPTPTPSTTASGNQQPKRLRLACDSCHGAKIRCSGGQPCKKCHNSNLQCKYSYMARLGKPKGSRNKKTLERLAAAAESPSNTGNAANGGSSSGANGSEAMQKAMSRSAGTPSMSTSSLSEYDLHPSSASSVSSSMSSSSSSAVSSASSASSVLHQSPAGWPALGPNLYAPMDHHGLHNHHAAHHQTSLDLCLETSSLRGLLEADVSLSPASPEGLLPLSLISPIDKDTQSLLAYHSYLSPSGSDVINPFEDKSEADWGFGASLHHHRPSLAMSVADTTKSHSPSPMMQQQQHVSVANLVKTPPMSGISSSGSSINGGNGSNTATYGTPEHHDASAMSMPPSGVDEAGRQQQQQQQQQPVACGCLRILTNKLCALNEVERKADHLRLDTTLSKGSAVLTCSATALACPLCLLDSKVILLVMTLLQTIINWARDGCGSSTAPQDSPPVVFGEWPVSREDGNAVRAVLITRVMTRTATTLDILRQRIRDFAAVAKQQKLAYQAMEAEALQATLQRVVHSMGEVTQMIKAKGLDA